jgi:hypothetical protein
MNGFTNICGYGQQSHILRAAGDEWAGKEAITQPILTNRYVGD